MKANENVVPRFKATKKKPKVPTKTQLLKRCDETFSKIVRARGRCVHCGTTEHLQCAHGFSRRYRAVRFDFRNAFALCRSCHVFYTHRPLEWDQWMRLNMGTELHNELRVLALTGRNPDLAETLARLRARLAQIEEAA